MTELSVLVKPAGQEIGKSWTEQMSDFIVGVKRGIEARNEGRVQPLDEVITELGIII